MKRQIIGHVTEVREDGLAVVEMEARVAMEVFNLELADDGRSFKRRRGRPRNGTLVIELGRGGEASYEPAKRGRRRENDMRGVKACKGCVMISECRNGSCRKMMRSVKG